MHCRGQGRGLDFGKSGFFDVAGFAGVHFDMEVVIRAVAADFDNPAVAGQMDAGGDIASAIAMNDNSVADGEENFTVFLVSYWNTFSIGN